MLQNFDYPDIKVNPGVYWYFSFTFQLYLFYAFARKWINLRNLLIWSILSLIFLWLIGLFAERHVFSIYRHCFTGWFPVFALGIYYSMKKREIKVDRHSLWLEIVLAFILLGIMVLMNNNFHVWIFLPIVGLYWFFALAKIVLCSGPYVSKVFAWIGKYSAAIFVCHPIARTVVNRLYVRFDHLEVIISLFFVLTLIIAFYYDKLYKLLLKRFVK
jgi:hypothetical protein